MPLLKGAEIQLKVRYGRAALIMIPGIIEKNAAQVPKHGRDLCQESSREVALGYDSSG
jgi:hypothetical protein